MDPYYTDGSVTLWHGDMRALIPALQLTADCIVADPPYGETSLAWDRWPDGWPTAAAGVASSMWCFGSMRMFLDRHDEFRLWSMSQDVVWEKHTGTSPVADRFKRVHEYALHWYRGPWSAIHHETPRVAGPPDRVDRNASAVRRSGTGDHLGAYGTGRLWQEDGTRLMRSIIPAKGLRGRALHKTEKPTELLRPLIEYACPPGGTVLDPFAGSASTAVAARLTGRRAVLIEADEKYCEVIAKRLAQDVLPLSGMRPELGPRCPQSPSTGV
jgi:site-specific DNA-methyltransferase (adenine-specific)